MKIGSVRHSAQCCPVWRSPRLARLSSVLHLSVWPGLACSVQIPLLCSYAWFTFWSRQDENESVKGTFISCSTLSTCSHLVSKLSEHVGKSISSQRKRECLECLASLSTILARECECLHSCVLCLVHILPKVSTSTRNKNVNQALDGRGISCLINISSYMFIVK